MIRFVKALAATLFIALAPIPAIAQQVANHAVPIGRGAGVVGFAAAAPSSAGQVLLDKGSSTNPAFTALGGDVASTNSSGSVTLDSEIHCLAALTSAADKIAYYTGSGTCALGDFGSAVRTFNTTSSSANLRALLTDEVGTGVAYFVGGALGTPASATLTNATGLPISGITGLGTGVGTALAVNVGSAGAPVLFNGAGGTPSAITLTNGTALPVSGITASTSTPLGVGSIELGHATDTTFNRVSAGVASIEGVNIVTTSSTDTLSNKTLASPTVTGTGDNQGILRLSSFVTSTQITANQNDYTATDGSNTCTTKGTLRISSDASRNITGLSCGQSEGGIRIIYNVGANPVVLTNQDTGSTAANRFLFGGDITLAADTSVTIKYDGVASRWRAITSPGAGGGGGGVTSVAIAAGVGITTSGTCTITTSGTCTVSMADQYRQNELLGCADASKLLVAYVRRIETFCDGYKASDGVNAGSSSNYTVNTTSGYVGPDVLETRITGGTPTVGLGSGTAANVNDNNTGTSISWVGSDLSAAAINSRILAKIDYGSNKTVTRIEAVGFSQTAGSAGYSLYYSTDGTNWTALGATVTGTSSATTTSRTGSVTARYVAVIMPAISFSGATVTLQDLNAYQSALNNMTVVTTSQTADATVSNGRVLMEIDPIDSITLNTDLTVDVTCDGTSHWAAATLSSIGKGQSGRTVVETSDTSCGANTGTSFGARIKTLNNKSVNFYKTTVTVH